MRLPTFLQPEHPDRSARRLAAGALLLGWAIFFAPQIFSARVPFYRDNLISFLPFRAFIHARLRQGALPQWFPYESLGVPFIGQIATAVFHPLTWLLLPLTFAAALKWNILLAYLLGLVGAYRLARELGGSRAGAVAAAFAFGFGGYLLGVSSLLIYLMGTATLPWVAWASHRLARRGRLKDVALLGIAWALVFYAADAQAFLCCAWLPVLAAVVERSPRRRWGLLVCAGALAAGLVAAELLPALAISAVSARVQGVPSPTLGFTWALHPWRLPELLIPGYIPDEVRYRVTGELFRDGTATFATTLFAGGIAVILALLGLGAPRRGAAAAYGLLGLGFLWLALGDQGGLLPAIQHLVPLLHRFRYPVKYVAFFWLALIPLVAGGVDRAHQASRGARLGFGGLALLALGLGMVAGRAGLCGAVWRLAGQPLDPADPARAVIDQAWTAGLLWTAVFCAAAFLLALAAPRRPLLGAALAVLIFLELWHGNHRHFPVIDGAALSAPNATAKLLLDQAPPNGPPPRLARDVGVPVPLTVTGTTGEQWVQAVLASLRPNVGAFYGVASFGENLGATPTRQVALWGSKDAHASRYAGLFNGCFAVERGPPGDPRALATWPLLGWELVARPCWPRAFLAGTLPCEADEALARLRTGRFSLDGLPWEGGPPLAHATGSVAWISDSPDRIELQVAADRPTGLVLGDAFAQGWTATVDGAPTPIYPALVVARGVAVPAGTHRVSFHYRTPHLMAGMAVSVLTLLVCLGLWLVG